MSVIADQETTCFWNEALNVIWRESRIACLENHYRGISLQIGGSKRDISVLYACSRSTHIGQDQRYPIQLWPHICEAMRILNMIANRAGYDEMVWFSEEVPSGSYGFCSEHWYLFLAGTLQSSDLGFLKLCLQRVDEVLSMLDQPL